MIRGFLVRGRMAVRIVLLLSVVVCSEAAADYDGVIAAHKRDDNPAALTELLVAANKDDPFSQNKLGTMYAQGMGVGRNYKLALDWFFKAQALGSLEATANLARMYAEGLGVPKDNLTALRYFRDAALAGFQPAILRMAKTYETGELGVTPDPLMARSWRDQLQEPRGEIGNVPVVPPKAVVIVAPPRKSVAATVILAKPSMQDDEVRARIDAGELSERKIFERLDNYRKRERKLFVASTDETSTIATYLKDLRTQLKSRLVSAFSASRPEESMFATLSILKDGTLREVELNRGSETSKTNSRVLSSLKRLTRLKPLPAETGGDVDVLVVTVRLPIEGSR